MAAMNLTGKKILICEEALIDEKGHFQSWIKAIRKMHLDVGATVFVAGNKAVIPEVRDDLGVMPVYTVNSWNQAVTGQWPSWRRYLHVFAQNWRVFWQTRKALKKVGPVDVVLFTAVRIHHLLGLRLLCTWGLGRKFDRLVCFLLTSSAEYNEHFTEFRFPRQSGLLKTVLRSFARLAKERTVLLAGDSHVTCSEYEQLSGVPITLFPSPGADLCYERQSDEGSETAVFTMLGVSTWDKGIDIFHDAIELFLARNPTKSVKFVLQWGVDCVGPSGDKKHISEAVRGNARVALYERRLTNDEYAKLFRKSDFIVLPYRKCTYFNRISGVAVEAAVSAKPMIVTERTWLEWAIREFGSGLSVPEGDVDCLCSALERCCAEWHDMATEALQRAEVALAYNSPERYLSILYAGLPMTRHFSSTGGIPDVRQS